VKHESLEIRKKKRRFRALGNKALQTVMERKVGMSNDKEKNSIINKFSNTYFSVNSVRCLNQKETRWAYV
jgi:hypothetical protein